MNNRNHTWRKPKEKRPRRRSPKSLRWLIPLFSILALLCFLIGFVYLIMASRSLLGMSLVFLVLNAAELLIYPIICYRGLAAENPDYYRHYPFVWMGILALQLICMLIQTKLESPLFFILPGALLLHNVHGWWVSAGNIDMSIYYYSIYHIFFIFGGFFSILLSIAGIIAPFYAKAHSRGKKRKRIK